VGNPLTLKRCPELCRLEILKNFLGETEHTVISSITSLNLHTIAFLPDTHCYSSPHYWNPLDNIACGLVNKLRALGYKHTLELELQFESAKFDPKLGFRGFLTEFRERGRVRILNRSSGELFNLAVRFSFAAYIVLRFLTHVVVKRVARSSLGSAHPWRDGEPRDLCMTTEISHVCSLGPVQRPSHGADCIPTHTGGMVAVLQPPVPTALGGCTSMDGGNWEG